MRVGIDFSGVVVNSDVAKVAVARRFFGLELNPDNTLYTAAGERITPETRASLLALLFCTSELLSSPPIAGAVEYIPRLQAQGAEVTIVSNINHAGVSFAKQWLRQHGLRDVTFVSVGIGASKAAWLENGFDVFVDDKLSTLVGIGSAVPSRLLFSHAYNAAEALPAGVTRVTGWNGTFERILQVRQVAAG